MFHGPSHTRRSRPGISPGTMPAAGPQHCTRDVRIARRLWRVAVIEQVASPHWPHEGGAGLDLEYVETGSLVRRLSRAAWMHHPVHVQGGEGPAGRGRRPRLVRTSRRSTSGPCTPSAGCSHRTPAPGSCRRTGDHHAAEARGRGSEARCGPWSSGPQALPARSSDRAGSWQPSQTATSSGSRKARRSPASSLASASTLASAKTSSRSANSPIRSATAS